MPKKLVIAEKPSVAADIARVVGAKKKGKDAYEGDDHVVSWALGHLLELLPPEDYDERFKRWRLQDLPIIPEAFKQAPIKSSRGQLSALVRLLKRKDVEQVVNACDAGREGELDIFRRVYRHAGSKKPVERLWLQSMTPGAIRQAIEHPRPLEEVDGLAQAADCRAESDWLIGMNATRALTVRLRTRKGSRAPWSAGRVQTAALAMVVARERQILAHEPHPYWLLRGTFRAGGPEAHEYVGTWQDPDGEKDRDRILEESRRAELLAKLEPATTARATETRKDRREAAPPLFDLTSLQREANRRHGMSARRVLQAAQSLYEGLKLITYPRTDSKALPSDYRGKVHQIIDALEGHGKYGPHARRLLDRGLQNEKRVFDDSAISDHFAIIPTGQAFPDDLPSQERQVFELIVRRFLAAFHPVAVRTEVERLTLVEGETFRTKASHLKEPGWRAVWGKEAEGADAVMPPLPPGDADGTEVEPKGFETEEKETKPPARPTEASLLGLMENAGREVADEELAKILRDKGGIGTPATRADVIETLLAREYVGRCKDLGGRRALRAMPRGVLLVEVLERVGLSQLTSAAQTAQLEDALREVERGELQRDAYMGEVKDSTRRIVDRLREFTYDELHAEEEPLGACPACDAPVRERLRTYDCERGGPGGECGFVIWKDVWGRSIDRRTAVQLVRERETPPKAGFFNRKDEEYEASLRLEAGHQVKVVPRSGADADEAEPEAEALDIGPCPFHPEWTVRRSGRGYRCDGVEKKECKLSLPLVMLRRPLSPEDIAGLIGPERKTQVLDGFISKRGRPFNATLKLKDDAGLEWEFPPRAARGKGADGAGGKAPDRPPAKEFPVNPEPVGKCPRHPEADVVETPTEYACSAEKCRFKMRRELCKREVRREEVAALLRDGETELIDDFISKRGKPFSARLKVNKRKAAGWEYAFER